MVAAIAASTWLKDVLLVTVSGLSKDPHDHSFDESMNPVPTETKYGVVDANYCFLQVSPR